MDCKRVSGFAMKTILNGVDDRVDNNNFDPPMIGGFCRMVLLVWRID